MTAEGTATYTDGKGVRKKELKGTLAFIKFIASPWYDLGATTRRWTRVGCEGGSPAGTRERKYAVLLRTELDRLVQRLRELGASKIVLFGSYARGREDLCTDLDLFVVMESDLPFVERTAWLYRELSPRVACDILAYTPREWEAMQERSFVREALRRGEVLYEKERS